MEEELGRWGETPAAACWQALRPQVEAAYAAGSVYPPRSQLFAALRLTPPDQVRAVILGQDPYHEPGQANGLAFSVPTGVKLPPSLRNIYRELQDDLGIIPPSSGDLTGWAKQGVLLLNTALTVAQGKADSHRKLGWDAFTDSVLTACAALPQPIALVLWGAHAQKKEPLLVPAAGPRLVLHAAHPSPLSSYRGFFGSKPFSQVNTFLATHGVPVIDWSCCG